MSSEKTKTYFDVERENKKKYKEVEQLRQQQTGNCSACLKQQKDCTCWDQFNEKP